MNEDHLVYSIKKFERLAKEQEKKGIKKYGKPLDPKDLKYDWIDMALEEQVDGTKYLFAEIEKRRFIVGKIKKLLNAGNIAEDLCQEINFWLDVLEGK